ncbi:MAG: tetratricopeptide repeat protein [Parcubacteria group bacterium ADurb.Bin316]|nr:MAG: tetratricopeptide repeat protein [Parcubacteria group bacterium ADurb.Bin316]
MFNIIPLILIIISLILIINIVVKKFSALASLDVASIPAEKEAVFKERIMGNRLKREFFKYYSKLLKFLRPFFSTIGRLLKTLYGKLIDFKENYNRESSLVLNTEDHISKLLAEAEDLVKKDEYDEAEKRYIEIISLDSKNLKAFRSLGRLYAEEKKYQEAEQTLMHVLRLIDKEVNQSGGEVSDSDREEINSQLAETHFDLVEVNKGKNNLSEAISCINEALAIIPNNPRYLDTKLEISIMNKDKSSALEAYDKMAEVNPDNQKLGEFKKKIEEL